jgi:hypothetical protein
MIIDYKEVTYKKKGYIVCLVEYNGEKHLFVFDKKNQEKVFGKPWHYKKGRKGYIAHQYFKNNKTKTLYLHNFLMNFTPNGMGSKITVDHINRVPLDNREANLRLADKYEQIQNQGKRKKKNDSNKVLKDAGIEPDDIPKFISLNKHKEDYNFMIAIDNVYYYCSSTSSSTSLKCKLEQAKRYLRLLYDDQPEIFDGMSLCGELTKKGLKLRKSYNKILKLSGFPDIEKYLVQTKFKTFEECVKENFEGLSEDEITFVKKISLEEPVKRRRTFKVKIPSEVGITADDLPKHVTYVATTEKCGDFFRIINHPILQEKYNKTVWKTSTSMFVSSVEKYKELLDFLPNLEPDKKEFGEEAEEKLPKPKPKKKKVIVV